MKNGFRYRIGFLLAAVIVLSGLYGCGQNGRVEQDALPQKCAGSWSNVEAGWAFVLEDDGTISKVVRMDGLVMDVKAGGASTESADQQLIANYVYGPCRWSWDAPSGSLRAVVTIEDLYVKAMGAELSCKVIDEFAGPVSEDGRVWTASWKTTTKWHDGSPDQVVDGGVFELTKAQ